jgi:hypothetical protein
MLRERVTCEGDHSWRILWPGEKPGTLIPSSGVEIEEDEVFFEPIKG